MRKMVYSTGVLSVVGIVGVGGLKGACLFWCREMVPSHHRLSQWINQFEDLLFWGYIFSNHRF